MPAPATPIMHARPRIAVSGQDKPGLKNNLLELSVVLRLGEPSRCTARFLNRGVAATTTDFLYSDRTLLDFGKQFSVAIGQTQRFHFNGRIYGLNAELSISAIPNISVLALDRLEDLRMVRRTRSFEDVSDSEIIRRIASDHGLSSEVELNGPTHKVLAQINQTDLAFLNERVIANDAMLWIENTKLCVNKAREQSSNAPLLVWGDNLQQFSAQADLTTQRTRLRVTGWDITSKSSIDQEIDASGIANLANGESSGPAILQQAFGERIDTFVSAVPLTEEEARQRASSAFRSMARRFIGVQGVAEFDARLLAGVPVDVRGVGELFDGIYRLNEVKHIFEITNGARTEFTAEKENLN